MKLLHELVSDYAVRFPDKTAVKDSCSELSYSRLDALSAAFAQKLRSLGIRNGDMVAVYVPRIKEVEIGILAVLRAGGIYIPFDEAYPINRLEYMLKDSQAKAIMTVHSLWDQKSLNFPDDNIVFLDEDAEKTGDALVCDPLSEESPAMLLYTSGTTGNPKGVLHNHNMLLHISEGIKLFDDAAMNCNTRTCVMADFPFIAAQLYLVGPLLEGGTVCIAPEAVRKDPGLLYNFMREEKITHLFLPSGLAAIMAEDYDLSGIYVTAGGEKLRNFRPFSPGNILLNQYGSTETCAVLGKKISGNEERILVGKPYKTIKILIVDEALHPVPAGEPGELLSSSSFMSKSYYKLPELSAEKWVEIDGVLWFRTGDRAVMTPDGDIDILGRVDNMIKIRGFRVETGEVEAQISTALPKIGRNDIGQLVVVSKNVMGTDHLCCYYEAKKEIDKKAITKAISQYLAEYMIPDVWVRMDALPRNVNGKVMRKELPQPKRERKGVGILDNEVIARLLFTAAYVLDTDCFIAPEDRFTDLGGTSLNAMQYSVALRDQGIKLSGSQILQYNEFRKLAEVAEVEYAQLWSQDEYNEVRRSFAARGEHIEKVLPISPMQDEMLFKQIISPDTDCFRTVLFLQIDSIVSEKHLRDALDILSSENEELRSAVVFHDVTVVQQVITDRRIPLEMIVSDNDDIKTLDALSSSIEYKPMDLQFDSIIRFVCLHAEGMSFLYVMAHEIAVSQEQLKGYLARLMQILETSYPDDASISGWREILEMKLGTDEEEDTAVRTKRTLFDEKKAAPSDICVYSENSGPKMVFVHTGNTGSDAYYRLADRIGDEVSFAVIEPFNLYHSEEAVYGIKNIAANYIRILKNYQPEGPYILGGWCYGGVVAHEMACQLEQAGESVQYLFMLDSHALGNEKLREMSKGMLSEVNVEYFETSPLFAELRESGMLEAMVKNAAHVSEDLMNHVPSVYHGSVTYFKPDVIPAGVTGDNFRYWTNMMKFEAGNYENYCNRDKMKIIHTPHEHDLMMDDQSLDIIVPEIMKAVR